MAEILMCSLPDPDMVYPTCGAGLDADGLCPTHGKVPDGDVLRFVQPGCPAGFSSECSSWTSMGECKCATLMSGGNGAR